MEKRPIFNGSFIYTSDGETFQFRSQNKTFVIRGKERVKILKHLVSLIEKGYAVTEILESSRLDKRKTGHILREMMKRGIISLRYPDLSGYPSVFRNHKCPSLFIIDCNPWSKLLYHKIKNRKDINVYLIPYEEVKSDIRREKGLLFLSFKRQSLNPFMIFIDDKPFPEEADIINEFALRYKLPLLVGFRFIKSAYILSILPGVSYCYRCFIKRVLSTKEDLREFESFISSLKNGGIRQRSSQYSFDFIDTLNKKILKILENRGSQDFTGRVFNIDLDTNRVEVKWLMRLPHCKCDREVNKKRISSFSIRGSGSSSGLPQTIKETEKLIDSEFGICKRIVEVKDLLPVTLHFYVAETVNMSVLSDTKTSGYPAGGVSIKREEAYIKCMGEMIERYCGFFFKKNSTQLLRKSYKELKNGNFRIQDFIFYSDSQYSEQNFPFHRFEPELKIDWTRGFNLTKNIWSYIPAILVWLGYTPPRREEFIFRPNSNGLASGTSYNQSILNGILELVERDNFLIHWFSKLSPPYVSVPHKKYSDLSQLVRKIERASLIPILMYTSLDIPVHSFASAIIDPRERFPVISFGLGCDFDPSKAAKKALQEALLTRRNCLLWREYPEFRDFLKDFKEIRQINRLEHHALAYSLPQMKRHWEFILKPPEVIDLEDIQSVRFSLKGMLRRLEQLGIEVTVIDITTPDISSLGWKVVKILASHLHPFNVGYNTVPLGGKRLSKFRGERPEIYPPPHPVS